MLKSNTSKMELPAEMVEEIGRRLPLTDLRSLYQTSRELRKDIEELYQNRLKQLKEESTLVYRTLQLLVPAYNLYNRGFEEIDLDQNDVAYLARICPSEIEIGPLEPYGVGKAYQHIVFKPLFPCLNQWLLHFPRVKMTMKHSHYGDKLNAIETLLPNMEYKQKETVVLTEPVSIGDIFWALPALNDFDEESEIFIGKPKIGNDYTLKLTFLQ